jgi:predicted RNase H-like HicB family nuclease
MDVPRVRVVGQVEWTAFKDSKSNQWVGTCTELNLTTGGDTWVELQQNAQDAMNLLFEELYETGELDATLKRLNLKLLEPIPEEGKFNLDLATPTSISESSVTA